VIADSDQMKPGATPTINLDNGSAPSIAPEATLSTPDVAAAATPLDTRQWKL
jgi:hypothetical protein